MENFKDRRNTRYGIWPLVLNNVSEIYERTSMNNLNINMTQYKHYEMLRNLDCQLSDEPASLAHRHDTQFSFCY